MDVGEGPHVAARGECRYEEPVPTHHLREPDDQQVLAPRHAEHWPVQTDSLEVANQADAGSGRNEVDRTLVDYVHAVTVVTTEPTHEYRRGVLAKRGKTATDVPWVDPVIVGQPHEVLAARRIQDPLIVGRVATIERLTEVAHAQISGGQPRRNALYLGPGRRVVRDQHLDALVVLRERGPDCTLEVRGAAKRRDADRHEGLSVAARLAGAPLDRSGHRHRIGGHVTTPLARRLRDLARSATVCT